MRDKLSKNIYYFALVIFFSAFILLSYRSVQARGEQWRENGEATDRFLMAIKRAIPTFPPNSYIFVVDPPTGRAYLQQSLNAFYGGLGLTLVIDPKSYRLKPGDNAYLVVCNWKPDGNVDLDIKLSH